MIKFYVSRISIFSIIISGMLSNFPEHTYGQNNLPQRAIQVVGGYSRHGSGDFHGITFGAEFIRYISKSVSLNYNFRGSINDGKESIIVNNLITGTTTDASIRFTTAGVQFGANGRYTVMRTSIHEVAVSLGAFGRYQSASNGSDGYSIYYPQTTGQPTVLVGYDNHTPQETFSLGGIFQLEYNYQLPQHYYIGVLPGFQTDTNGDAILQLVLAIGKRF